jgi:hypothetical protein
LQIRVAKLSRFHKVTSRHNIVVPLIFTLFWMSFASEKLERSDKRQLQKAHWGSDERANRGAACCALLAFGPLTSPKNFLLR